MNKYKLSKRKIAASIVFLITLIILSGFFETAAATDADFKIFIIQSVICLLIMLAAVVIGRLYEDIPDYEEENTNEN